MKQQIKNILAVVTTETLEKLAFLFAFPDGERRKDGPAPAMTGRVEFNGYFSGSLIIRISQGTAAELATNMLGLDDDSVISDEEQQDAFKEMLNVICGNLLPAMVDDQVEFNIGPSVVLAEEDAGKALNGTKPVCVARSMLEDGFCDVYLFADEERLEEAAVRKVSVHHNFKEAGQ